MNGLFFALCVKEKPDQKRSYLNRAFQILKWDKFASFQRIQLVKI
ncbi:hypothetical protein D1BOALGB6SA_358 [Olavius sp. associated proteobacterium Delta 1]|nr:hypothetical protein D1BOALGB6SA_358 [Olavius sp. associated proteobacterium Delta 1]